MEDFFQNTNYQEVGSMILELAIFLIVVIVVVAILDRWGPNKPTVPPRDGEKPESGENSESRVLKYDDSSPIPLEGDKAESDTDDPLASEGDEKLPPPPL